MRTVSLSLNQRWAVRYDKKSITLVCPECGKSEKSNRVRLLDPPEAVKITIICYDCDDGDFHAPVYYGADGKEILQ